MSWNRKTLHFVTTFVYICALYCTVLFYVWHFWDESVAQAWTCQGPENQRNICKSLGAQNAFYFCPSSLLKVTNNLMRLHVFIARWSENIARQLVSIVIWGGSGVWREIVPVIFLSLQNYHMNYAHYARGVH